MFKIQSYIVLLLFLITFPVKSNAEDLPRASTENCFYIMPLFEQIRVPGALTIEEKRAQFLKMKQQLGTGNLYHRLGFSGIYAPNVDAEVRDNCKLAQEYGIHLGLIFADQSHTRNDLRNVAAKDFRLFQWRKDGIDWKGAFTSSGELEIPEDQRDYKIPTPSRLATPLQEYNAEQVQKWAEAVKKLMADFPGVITCINGPIEEELPVGGYSNQDKLGDYSPYAITEFRDWLQHKGIYDATSGKFKGEGAISLIVGNFIDFKGTQRSQFYDDPTPDDSFGTGVSFNTFFGTNFTSWNLRYWDLIVYPDPIVDENFDCTHETGPGFTNGGFDAPRILSGTNKFWRAWSYEINDQGGIYPQGNPATPAFGFRQTMVRNFVRDLFDVLCNSGLPRNIMYAHQIPGEALSSFTGGNNRLRSSASTIWSGYLEKSQTVGITRFSSIDPDLITQYANDWGIFEWHTSPNTDANSQVLYDKSRSDLTNYYTHKCHYLFPGWWKSVPDNDLRFPLNDSRFADAIRDFIQGTKEVPYNQQGIAADYTPPVVGGVYGYFENNALTVNWDEKIWSDLLARWSDWGDFLHFEVQKSLDGINWGNSESSTISSVSINAAKATYQIRVRAVSKKSLAGPWSKVALVDENSTKYQFSLSSEFQSLDPNPDLMNRITISLKDINQTINPETVTVSISGDGKILNTEPENAASVEKFWPMDSMTELTGVYRLDNQLCADGFFGATVSPITPIDPYFSLANSKIDGSKLPYISFKLYSDVASEGRLYWFIAGGNKSVIFNIKEGWNSYTFSNLPDWTSQTSINSVRLDPGITASAIIKLDWMAISSHPISETLKPSLQIAGNKATFLTSPTSNPGSYKVSVSINGNNQEVTIQTKSLTGFNNLHSLRPIHFIYPNPAKNSVTLNLNGNRNASIRISALNGRLIKQFEFSGVENPVISVADMTKGLYIIQACFDKERFTEKLIKL